MDRLLDRLGHWREAGFRRKRESEREPKFIAAVQDVVVESRS